MVMARAGSLFYSDTPTRRQRVWNRSKEKVQHSSLKGSFAFLFFVFCFVVVVVLFLFCFVAFFLSFFFLLFSNNSLAAKQMVCLFLC